ncbi:MAG TPA: type I-MYXAN CRISPR-associated Cas8a1/Cmx1 [Pseudomonadota bacterium]|nr:type I-MYXAN CRISPR-associated Cas8a1/Cmx1 [Pseudomonadota bacterium]
MGEVKKKKASVDAVPVKSLVIGLFDPGMTPLFRAGLGGLAASLRARMLEIDPTARWPRGEDESVEIPVADGTAVVQSQRICIHFGPRGPEAFLQDLFEHAFRLRPPHQVIDLPGTYTSNQPVRLGIQVASQDAVTRTFLQHGSTRKPSGSKKPVSTDIDDKIEQVIVQPLKSYVHQKHETWRELADAIKGGQSVQLSGWAYPGAILRHDKFKQTGIYYSGPEALCGCFALVGCVSLQGSRNSGILVIPEPNDLLRFAETRPQLSPQKVSDAFVTGVSDAVLLVELVLRMLSRQDAFQRHGVRNVRGVLLRSTPWASQQKLRVRIIDPSQLLSHLDDEVLDLYECAVRELPTTLHIRAAAEEDQASFFPIYSELRAFITDNLAAGRRWFQDFGTAKTDDPKHPQFLHRYWSKKDNLGALRPEERKGLIKMSTYLSETEKLLVRSVHVALRQRYGAIAAECEHNDVLRKNRFDKETERWRLNFAGAKTHAQVRASLTDLWSRAGRNSELQAHWPALLPLLHPDEWQLVRDLVLLALASYAGSGAKENTSTASSGAQEQNESSPY